MDNRLIVDGHVVSDCLCERCAVIRSARAETHGIVKEPRRIDEMRAADYVRGARRVLELDHAGMSCL